MIKYDECILAGRKKISECAKEWKDLNKEIKNKKARKEDLEEEKHTLENELDDFNLIFDHLKSGKKRKRNIIIKKGIIICGIVLLAFKILNWLFSFSPKYTGLLVDGNIIITVIVGAVILWSFLYYNLETQNIKKLEKKYSITELSEKIKSKTKQLQKVKYNIKDLDLDLARLNSERNKLKAIILAFNNLVKEMESKKQAYITKSIIPSLESHLDADFQANYGDINPLEVVTRKRINVSKGEQNGS